MTAGGEPARQDGSWPAHGLPGEAPPPLRQLLFGDGTPRKALATALVVGTVLTLINHGDVILLHGAWPPAAKLLLTFAVPYCVATWGAVTAKQTLWQKAHPRARQVQPAGQSGDHPGGDSAGR